MNLNLSLNEIENNMLPQHNQKNFFHFRNFILIKKNHTLNCYPFFQKFLLKTKTYKLVVGNAIVSMVAQFTAKTINLEKVLMSYSMNKLKSHILLTCKNFVFRLYVEKKKFLLKEMVGGEGLVTPPPLPPFPYDRQKGREFLD